MITKQQYMNDSSNLHRAYYAQFVNDAVTHAVVRKFGVEPLIKSFQKDKHFNTNLTPLEAWDLLGGFVFSKRTGEILMRPTSSEPIDYKLLKETGEGYSSSTAVCVYKEAARQVVENALNVAISMK